MKLVYKSIRLTRQPILVNFANGLYSYILSDCFFPLVLVVLTDLHNYDWTKLIGGSIISEANLWNLSICSSTLRVRLISSGMIMIRQLDSCIWAHSGIVFQSI